MTDNKNKTTRENKEMEVSVQQPPKVKAGLRIAGPCTFWGGIALLIIGVTAFWMVSNLSGIRGYTFGAGTMPRLIAGLLITLSLLLIVMGLTVRGPALPRLALRGPIMLFAAIVFFALTLAHLGIVVCSFLTYLIAALATRETRWGEALIAGVGMTVFCTALFYYGLSLPFPLWPAL